MSAGTTAPEFDQTIVVPFPPESAASGVHDTGFHNVLWYHRRLSDDDIRASGHAEGRRLIVRFGAVDYRAIVWVNGERVGSHEGGHTPFSFDITDVIQPGGENHLVVRVEDDPLDVSQPRGKQDWREAPHVIWYHRTSGIWQPVWLESVPAFAIDWIHWRSDDATAQVHARVGLTVGARRRCHARGGAGLRRERCSAGRACSSAAPRSSCTSPSPGRPTGRRTTSCSGRRGARASSTLG